MRNKMAIKVFIQTDKFKGGPAVFRSRLISALNKFDDIKITNNISDKFDIELAFIRRVYKHNKPYILRVDGCYYQKNKRSNNRATEDAILNSRYLIFQSKFSLELCKKILNIKHKVSNNCSIIYNGIDLDYIKKIKVANDIEPGSFVACARWRDNKRTFSIIKGFIKANTGRHLYMIGGVGMGENSSYESKMRKYKSKYIHILGKKKAEETISILKACDYHIHLCHIDSCPNIVLESLSCGLNVLCSNLGGTRELVRDDGIVLKADKMWDGKYLSSSVKLDSLDKKEVAKGIHRLMEVKTKPDIFRFNMDGAVEKYVKIIRENV
jgi:glycosyltransferase involved in cell wall biosynthesis